MKNAPPAIVVTNKLPLAHPIVQAYMQTIEPHQKPERQPITQRALEARAEKQKRRVLAWNGNVTS